MERNAIAYNEALNRAYRESGSIETLEKLVVSETLSPIGDYGNAVKLIRDSYPRTVSFRLLILGALWTIDCCPWEQSIECLDVLNSMYPFLPAHHKAMIDFLNADRIWQRGGPQYKDDPLYEEYLRRSVEGDPACLRSRRLLADLYQAHSPRKSAALYEEILAGIEEVFTAERLSELGMDHFCDPENCIKEFVLGTHVTFLTYDEISANYNKLKKQLKIGT